MIDFNLNEGNAVINDEISYIIQQIDILFDSNQGDLIGDLDYGTDYEYYLYELKMSASMLKEQMESDLATLDLCGYNPDVKVYLMQGTERDIAVIAVDLIRQSEKYTKIYKIQ